MEIREPIYIKFSDDGQPCLSEEDDGTETIQTVMVIQRVDEIAYVQKVHYKNMIGKSWKTVFILPLKKDRFQQIKYWNPLKILRNA